MSGFLPHLCILSSVLSLQCEQEPFLSTLLVHCLISSSLSPHQGIREQISLLPFLRNVHKAKANKMLLGFSVVRGPMGRQLLLTAQFRQIILIRLLSYGELCAKLRHPKGMNNF